MSRIVLRYPQPVVAEESGHETLFYSPPQSAPVMASSLTVAWQELKTQLSLRLRGTVTMTCHPHRIGHRACVALRFQGECGRTDILITVSGRVQFPQEEDYQAPRWYIDVADIVDALYLVLWLGDVDECPFAVADTQR
ncbi:hypothetical protein EJH27_01770 [Salmonella enterica subsp. enterica serovar Virchow]|nr:hypothetical protein [Salmonella enterica subsp. enterica serovar Virchow]